MAEYFVKRPIKRPPVHSGEILREDVLPTLGLSVSETAKRLGISRQQLHRILACTHPITTEMALRIAFSNYLRKEEKLCLRGRPGGRGSPKGTLLRGETGKSREQVSANLGRLSARRSGWARKVEGKPT